MEAMLVDSDNTKPKWLLLEEILNVLFVSHTKLLNILELEKVALLEGDSQQILKILQDKEKQLGILERLELERIELCKSIAIEWKKLDQDDIRLLKLAQFLPNGEFLKQSHAKLSFLITELAEKNQENALYAKAGLRTVESTMDGIKDVVGDRKTYGQRGQYQKAASKNGHFVSREV